MGSRNSGLVLGLVSLVFAVACNGPAPVIPSAGTPTGATTTPLATMAPRATPVRTIATAPTLKPTPTEPRLGINPPGSPATVPNSVATPASPPFAGRRATIMQIQGTGTKSAYAGQTVAVTGVVTGSYQALPLQGFFLQAASGDGDAATSDGIFVFHGDRSPGEIRQGDSVDVIGVVREAYGRTTIDVSQAASSVTRRSSGNRLPEPVELRPPPVRTDAARYYESLEGMLVRVPDAVVVGPTSRFGEFAVVRADSGLTRVFQSDTNGPGQIITVDDGAGPDARYEVTSGDQVTGIIGPLDYSYGQFKVEQFADARLRIMQGARLFVPVAAPAATEFTVASFNLENLFDPVYTPGKLGPCDVDAAGVPCRERVTPADYQRKLTKAARAIRDALGAPTIVGVQEVESLAVLSQLAAQPELSAFGYEAALLDGVDPRGINVGLLYRAEAVTVHGATQLNECTTESYGFSDVEARCSSKNNGTLDGYWLAARPPLVVDLTVGAGASAERMTVIVNHFKSKGGVDPENKQFTSRRTAEARLVARAVQDLVRRDPNARIIVLGDLNDFVASAPLKVLTSEAPLYDLAAEVPASARYSYIYNGESEVLDHVLVTANLRSRVLENGFVRIDADFPTARAADLTPFRVSDHDPAFVRFRLGR